LVANPGCYPTSILLALKPLIEAGGRTERSDRRRPSGVSGAGKNASARTHFGATNENPRGAASARTARARNPAPCALDRIVFVHHLLPVFHGILSTIYVPPSSGVGAGEVLACSPIGTRASASSTCTARNARAQPRR
jgi:N-acetyl-gamma-glutamyl-phosphate reductase